MSNNMMPELKLDRHIEIVIATCEPYHFICLCQNGIAKSQLMSLAERPKQTMKPFRNEVTHNIGYR